ncbi:MAG: hypothetical protein J7L73_02095 [Anaerolineales bacterium]|nr:hypothetical protein [Anaerolineales bacterium]
MILWNTLLIDFSLARKRYVQKMRRDGLTTRGLGRAVGVVIVLVWIILAG